MFSHRLRGFVVLSHQCDCGQIGFHKNDFLQGCARTLMVASSQIFLEKIVGDCCGACHEVFLNTLSGHGSPQHGCFGSKKCDSLSHWNCLAGPCAGSVRHR